LPKLENHLEARLWNDVFIAAQDALQIPRGTIRATVLIETILAAFEMNEILWELRDHIAGLNCGRWDYIFSYIKKFRSHAQYLLPDRSSVTMTSHFLSSYVESLVATCHRRRAHAMGGMAAQIPIKNDPEANDAAIAKVRKDKLREVWAGHDGTWVAHPGLVPVAKQVFDTYMASPNQLHRMTPFQSTAADLLCTPSGQITREGLEINIDVGLQYLAAWLGGNGCVPIYNLMEDAATAEICRAQVWQWLRHGAVAPSGVEEAMRSTVEKLQGKIPERELDIAQSLYVEMLDTANFLDFLTLRAYDYME
jgi:malate synthase